MSRAGPDAPTPTDRDRPLRVAAVDIGSNAIRFSAAEFDAGPGRLELEYRRVPVRLGHGAFLTGRLSPEAIDGAVDALASFRERLEALSIRDVRVVATSAVRESRNREDLTERVRREAGLRIETITGAEEARLVWLAVGDRFPLEGRWLLVDLGGGSLEVSVAGRDGIEWSESHAVGTVRLLEDAGGTAPGSMERLGRLLEERTRALRIPVLDDDALAGLIATGGNIEALAKLAAVARDGNGVGRLPIEELEATNRRLAAMTYRGRIDVLGLREDRADVIIPAGRVYELVARLAGAKAIVVPNTGVVEGVLLDLARGRTAPDDRIP